MPRSIAGRARATTAANVTENRARVAELLGAEPGRLLTVFQKHSADAVMADEAVEATASCPRPTPS